MVSRNLRWAVLGVTALLSASTAQAQTTLRYKFKEGETLNYLIEQKLSLKVEIDNQEKEMTQNQTLDVVWNILEVDKNGKAKMTYKFDRIRFALDSPKGKIEYDSKDGKIANDPFKQEAIFKALSGLIIPLSMDAMGEITDVVIPEKFLEAMKNASAGQPEAVEFTPDSIKKMLIQAGVPLPKEAVAKGKSWTQKVGAKLPFGEMKTDYGYTYEGLMTKGEQKLEQLAVKVAVTLEPDPNIPLKIKVAKSGGKGTAFFDNDNGRLLEMSVTQFLDMEAMGTPMRATTSLAIKLKQ